MKLQQPFTKDAFTPLLLLGSILMSTHALAQSTKTSGANDHALAEVVVTATKRHTNEQTTPQFITTFSAADLSVEHVNDLADLAKFTPGLFIGADNGFGSTSVAIRGFGPLNDGIGGEEAVGVYVDGVYQSTPYGNEFTFIDVDHVEVLSGPQGTLYGRNATGGAILIDTLTPGAKTVVRADVGAGQLNSYEGRALVSGPTGIDGLFGKIAVGKTDRDGWTSNPITGQKLNGESNFNTSAGLRWYRGGLWDVSLGTRYGTQNSTLAYGNANSGLPINLTPGVFPDETDRSFGAATLNATATMPWATFTAVGGYTNDYFHTLGSSGNVGLTEFLEVSKASEFYEEVRLASTGTGALSWIFGATALQQHASDLVNFALTAQDLGGPTGLGIIFQNGLETTSYAAYAELGWQIDARVRITAGDRYTWDRKIWSNCVTFGQFTDILAGTSNPVACDTPFNREAKTWSASTPKAVISAKLTGDMFAYASFNKGFRDGGWNFTSAVNPQEPYSTAFDPEYAKSYEVGLKSEFFDHRLRVNADAYLADYTELQVRSIDPVYHLLNIHNAGTARTKGVELQLLSQPTSALTIGGSAALERAVYTSFSYTSLGSLVNYAGHYLDDAPLWTGSLSAAYKFRLRHGGLVTPRIDANYQSRAYYTEQNAAPYDGQAHETLNLQLRYDAASAPWGWDIYVNNLTNNQWRTYVFQGSGDVIGASYALPRIAGIRLFWNE